jgi:uncharacterized protein YdgA (DUF945 family)
MLKRAPIIVVGIILIVLLGAPLVIGTMTENGFRQQTGIYTQNPALITNIDSYDRGWFSSRAEVGIRLSENSLAELDLLGDDPFSLMLREYTLPIIVEIAHGPLLFNDGLAFGSAGIKAYVEPESELATLATQVLAMPYLFEFRGKGGFGSGFQFEGEIPPFENALGEASYSSSGLEFSGVMQAGDTELHAVLETASYQSPLESMLLEGFRIDGDYDFRRGQLPMSDAEFRLERFIASNPLLGARPLLSLEGLAIGGTMSENDDGSFVDMQVFYRLANMEAAGLFAVSDFDLTVDLNHLESRSAARLYEAYNQQMATSPDQPDLSALITPLEQLLADEPTVTIDPLRFSMSGGDFNGTANLALDMDALPGGRLTDLLDPLVVLQALQMEVDLDASKTLVEYLGGLLLEQQLAFMTGPDGQPLTAEEIQSMADAQLNLMLTGLTAQGLLVDDGDRYSTSIEVANGTAVANGQPLPLGLF